MSNHADAPGQPPPADYRREIAALAHLEALDDRVHASLSVLENVMARQTAAADVLRTDDKPEAIEIEADDLFDLVSALMELPQAKARQIGMNGLAEAIAAPTFEEFRVSCLAVQRFCTWVTPRSKPARH